ncbi:LysR family transcriptional regulator [Rhizobium rhizogenes]|uniref:HTH-type transcriptional regulator TtuA n=2 Tax=Rhizobium rhizogenes TaxID=359 RepID=A0AA87PY35_RHIRH|nr:LysR family transcriptional regulator [Rhizobium rhizogenes]GAJ91968.1 putative LysR family transcriptional regulator [Rhizobium rhizogenes NBRC 13257]NTF64035.1 LysR family transcriptional regulator [Rhizobium rhizogenes]NTF76746.1 LysR family transcriptional regulator [Rhizobium rhizogenes]NTF83651.1 LysR family transcriptional regulator [Rhizobium rhizogenes]
MGMNMITPRRFLPSLSLLSAFEAAARTGSVTVAARELDLTQSAVSRQIKALEEQLGVELFVRERQTIRLTLAGDSYAREIREALRRISSASLDLRANPNGGTLNVAILPTFGTRWLAPRLGDFLATNPGITINLVTRLSPFDFRLDSIDAAIHFGHPHWPGAELAFLMSERTMPACSPDFLARHRLVEPADFLQVPLLHLTTRPDAWEKWLAANGAPASGVRGMLFDQFATAAQAAISGLGVALLPTFLIQEELKRGELVAASPNELESDERYYLACPFERLAYPPLVRFREWIVNQR